MKTFAAAVTFALAATGLAAPTIEKRATGTITFFTGTSYGGSSASLSFDSNTQQGYKCVNLPASVNNKALSVRLSQENGSFHCRLHDNAGCSPETSIDTWFFYVNIPDLRQGYTIGTAASSVQCGFS